MGTLFKAVIGTSVIFAIVFWYTTHMQSRLDIQMKQDDVKFTQEEEKFNSDFLDFDDNFDAFFDDDATRKLKEKRKLKKLAKLEDKRNQAKAREKTLETLNKEVKIEENKIKSFSDDFDKELRNFDPDNFLTE